MMYGYLAVMVSEDRADALLEMVMERTGKWAKAEQTDLMKC
jgi:hypothetical protein